MAKLLFLLSLIVMQSSFASILLPSDYEESQRFYKVEKEQDSRRSSYFFYECTGNIEFHSCDSIYDSSGYSTAELKSIERTEATKGGLILAAEIVTGGIIWKRLMMFTLGGATRFVASRTGWTEGVANGTIALGVMAPTNAGATVYVLDKTTDLLNMIDPLDRYRRSELVDTDEYEENSIINIKYGFQKTYTILGELLSTVEI